MSSTTNSHASPRIRGFAATPPRQEGRGVGTLSETARVLEKSRESPNTLPFGPDEREEKALQEWVEELLKNALAEDQRKEATERQRMEQEDAQSQRCEAWTKLRSRSR